MTGSFDGLAAAFTGALGQPVTIAPGGSAREITAIFVARSMDAVGVVTPQPAIHAADADLNGLADGESVTISGVTYIAREFRPDGRGMTTVVLARA